jgi:hypothetical protein
MHWLSDERLKSGNKRYSGCLVVTKVPSFYLTSGVPLSITDLGK